MIFILCPALPDIIVICIFDAHEFVFVCEIGYFLVSRLYFEDRCRFVLLFVLITISKLDLRMVVF